jgi:predicted RNase H-like HicB family nuclease
MNKFTIVFTECEEGGYSAYIKEVPGAISEGETLIETGENVFDALVQVLAAQAEEALAYFEQKTAELDAQDSGSLVNGNGQPREKEVDRRTGRVHSPIKVTPLE